MAVLDRVEDALAIDGVDDAYAAWVRFEPDPVAVAHEAERQHATERLWAGAALYPSQPAPTPVVAARRDEVEPSRPFDRLHTRLIEASERLLGGGEPAALPFAAGRASDIPKCAIASVITGAGDKVRPDPDSCRGCHAGCGPRCSGAR